MRTLILGLLIFLATFVAAAGEARAHDDATEVNRIICGLPHAEEQALLTSAAAHDPAQSRFCPLASSTDKKCPMNKGESSLIDCCCLQRNGADAPTIPLKDTFAGSATLAAAPLAFNRPAAAIVYGALFHHLDRCEAIPSPPPERLHSF